MRERTKYDDPMEEIYAIRKRISEECGHSIDRLVKMLAGQRQIDEANGVRYVNLPIVRRSPSVVQSA